LTQQGVPFAGLVAAVVVLAIAHQASAQTSVSIDEVGLAGRYKAGAFTPIRLSVSHRGEPVDAVVSLAVRQRDADGTFGRSLERVTRRLRLAPGTVTIDLPVRVPAGAERWLVAEAAREGAGLLATRALALEGPVTQSLVVLVCGAAHACERLQTEVTFALSPGFDRSRDAEPAFHRLPPARLPDQWWALSGVDLVVVAADVQELHEPAAAALERYLRQRGQVLLIEPAAARWLDVYRKDKADGRAVRAGGGRLFRTTGADRSTLGPVVRRALSYAGSPDYDPFAWGLRSNARTFALPSWRATLGYLLSYIACVGILNFALLRRLGRVELGWITVPVIALAFAVGAYAFATARQPDRHQMDEIHVLWRDHRSDLAGADVLVRILSPEAAQVRASAPGLLLVEAGSAPTSVADGFITHGTTPEPLNVEVTEEGTLAPVPMLRWSFRDLRLKGFDQAPGAVTAIAPGRIRNDTAVAFDDSCFVTAATVIFIGALQPGGAVDLDSARTVARAGGQGGARAGCLLNPDSILGASLEDGGGLFIGLQRGGPARVTLDASDLDTRVSTIHVIAVPGQP
jgi:hypothetical protein